MTYRPIYHFTAPSGWINDPNGLSQWNGVYHLFYQFHPHSTFWDDTHWGHAISRDLLHWEHKPIALFPDQPYDRGGVFSGSAVVVEDELWLYYTGNEWIDQEQDQLIQVQCLARTTDGERFEKETVNPVLASPPENMSPHWRDPKVWFHENHFWMVLGSKDESSGQVLLYRSMDGKEWQYRGILARDPRLGYMWECPDLFSCNGVDVLLFSPQGIEAKQERYQNLHQCGYITGQLDLEQTSFSHGAFRELDLGHDFYAAQTFQDENGRRILIGWLSMWEAEFKERAEGFAGMMTLPRELTFEEGQLYMRPVQECETLRSKTVLDEIFSGNSRLVTPIGFELCITGNRLPGTSLSLFLSFSFEIRWDDEGISMKRIGETGEEERISKRVVTSMDERLFVDASSVELFSEDGRTVFSSRFYPTEERVLQVESTDQVSDIRMCMYELKQTM